MAKANPLSWCCEGNSLSNEGIFIPATHTGKGKKLSGSVFYWVIKNFLRVYCFGTLFSECSLIPENTKPSGLNMSTGCPSADGLIE